MLCQYDIFFVILRAPPESQDHSCCCILQSVEREVNSLSHVLVATKKITICGT